MPDCYLRGHEVRISGAGGESNEGDPGVVWGRECVTRSDGPDQLCGPGGGRLLPVQSIPGKQGPRTGGRGGAGLVTSSRRLRGRPQPAALQLAVKTITPSPVCRSVCPQYCLVCRVVNGGQRKY